MVTLTPARIKFLASSVLGPLTGVSKTLNVRSLSNGEKIPFLCFYANEPLSVKSFPFLLCESVLFLGHVKVFINI